MSIETKFYVAAFQELLGSSSRKIQNGFGMLKANYRAEGRKISASKLAKAAGYNNYETGNEQYGSFAHKICTLIGYEPEQKREGDGTPIWTFALCDASDEKDSHGHFQWVLRNEVAEALEQLSLVRPIPIDDILSDIEEKKGELNQYPQKDREAILRARIGQGVFRERLINHWEGCSVTGYANTDLLIASHIKPWKYCSHYEALNMVNGLLLLPNIDLAFDRGFISFDKNGSIMFSPQFSEEDANAYGIVRSMKLRWCYPQHDEFLEFHRNSVFRSDN